MHDDCSSPPLRPTRMSSRDEPPRVPGFTGHLHSVWSSSGWGLPSRPSHPGRWCALTAPFHPYHAPLSCQGTTRIVRRSAFCCTFPDLAAGRRYRPSCSGGARTFLQSSMKTTSDRPTHSRRTGIRMIDRLQIDKVRLILIANRRRNRRPPSSPAEKNRDRVQQVQVRRHAPAR